MKEMFRDRAFLMRLALMCMLGVGAAALGVFVLKLPPWTFWAMTGAFFVAFGIGIFVGTKIAKRRKH